MTIFKSNACEITHCSNEVKPGKKRCKRCADLYDAQGVAFIIYCEFHSYYFMKSHTVTFWVSDGYVQRAPVPFQQTIGLPVWMLHDIMESKGSFARTIEPAIQP